VRYWHDGATRGVGDSRRRRTNEAVVHRFFAAFRFFGFTAFTDDMGRLVRVSSPGLQTVFVRGSSTTDMVVYTRLGRHAHASRTLSRRRRFIAEAIGVSDRELLANLDIAGYTPKTIPLLEFAPLVSLAWADGRVSPRQRSAIARVAARQHLLDETPAGRRLRIWLERCPSDQLVDVSLSTIRAKWDSLPLELYESLQRQFIRDCTAVARGADGVTCDNKIAPEEGRVLAKILLSLMPRRQSS